MAEKAERVKKTVKAPKTQPFVWEGRDSRGVKVTGESEAVNALELKAELRASGVTPSKVKRKSPLAAMLSGARKKVTPGDIAVFSRQIATMLASGVPLAQALEIMARGGEHPGVRELTNHIRQDVESGTALSAALAKHPQHFDDLYVSLVEAGEQAGVLDTLLDKIATYKEKTESIKGKIRKALFYPAAVLVVAFLVTAGLLIFVVPEFEQLFRGFGADLPVFTQFVITLSELFQAWWWAIFGALAGVGVAFVQARKRSYKFRRAVDKLSLRLPVVGPILHQASVARFARTLGTMFAAGVPLVEALRSVAGATGNTIFEEAVHEMREQVATGQRLQLSMRLSNLFSGMAVQMVGIGEEAGSLDTMLAKVADFYEEQVDNQIDALSSLLEPIIMVVLGVLVGGLVIAMYLPIFQMGAIM